jgi:hypothetical protein
MPGLNTWLSGQLLTGGLPLTDEYEECRTRSLRLEWAIGVDVNTYGDTDVSLWGQQCNFMGTKCQLMVQRTTPLTKQLQNQSKNWNLFHKLLIGTVHIVFAI